MRCYYNDLEPFACEWMAGLMERGLIPDGTIDPRSITEVSGDELRGYDQWHLFAGLAGWPLALRLAGMGATRSVLTASCPCQPFSTAGKRKGQEDERHLWPACFALVRQLRPHLCLGEQVASPDGYEWLDGVRADLEAEGYAFGACDLPACGVGADHIRNRLFWGAVRLPDAPDGGRGEGQSGVGSRAGQPDAVRSGVHDAGGGVAVPDLGRLQGPGLPVSGRGQDGHAVPGPAGAGEVVRDGGVADADGEGRQGGERQGKAGSEGPSGRHALESGGPTGPWSDSRWVECSDGKARRVPLEPRLFPLSDGVPHKRSDPRMDFVVSRLGAMGYDTVAARSILERARKFRKGVLKAAGNAIVPQAAAVFIRAFMESVGEVTQ